MNLGDRMKMYESQTTGTKLIPGLPIVARLDGVGFSKFTKGLKRPYDERLSKLMIDTTIHLVKTFNANCGYTQSDEITLVFYTESIDSQLYRGGKVYKLISDFVGECTVFFNYNLRNIISEKYDMMPRFDCRVWSVPTLMEAVNCFVWREQDATKNSVSMAAREYYSHSELENKHGGDMQEMLFEKDVNWNNYPVFFKRGTYVQKKVKTGKMSIDEIDKLPPKHNARKNPDMEIKRSYVDVIDMPIITQVKNPVEVIIYGKDIKLNENN